MALVMLYREVLGLQLSGLVESIDALDCGDDMLMMQVQTIES